MVTYQPTACKSIRYKSWLIRSCQFSSDQKNLFRATNLQILNRQPDFSYIGGMNIPNNPTWNRDYPYEDLKEYTSYQVTVKVDDIRFSIFPNYRDAYYYWKKLRHNLHRYGCELVEYMTMRTHLHFLALTKQGLDPLAKAIRATNVSYSMRLRYYAKHPRPYKDRDAYSLVDHLRQFPQSVIFRKNNCYIPIEGFCQLLTEMRYIKRNPERANSKNGDSFISSRREYKNNYFEVTDIYAAVQIAELFSMSPQSLHTCLMVDDDVWIEHRNKLIPADISREQELFKIPNAKFPLHTFRLPE